MYKINQIFILIFCVLGVIFKPIQLNAQKDSCSLICDGDFENVKIPSILSTIFFGNTQIPCWKTTASDGLVEYWASGNTGVPSYSGRQFIELNGNEPCTIYQTFVAPLSGTAELKFAHRGRMGDDIMRVEIGPENGPYTSLGRFTGKSDSWKLNKILYTFPSKGPTNYVLRFVSVRAYANSYTIGNFLDAVSFKLTPIKIDSTVIHPLCTGYSNGAIRLRLSGGSQNFTYNWSPRGLQNNDTIEGLQAGFYSVQIQDNFGCSAKYSFSLHSQFRPTFDTQQLSGADSVYWSATKKWYHNSGTYTARLTTHQGCDSILQLTIALYTMGPVFIPTAFTPDANGINELWQPQGSNIAWYQIQIYDRWGQCVFLGQNNQPFKGASRGNPVPEGIYPYLVKVFTRSGEYEYYRGTVFLLR